MFSFLKRYREQVIIGVLLVWPLISYLSSGHRGRAPNVIDRAVRFVSSPVQSLFTSLFDGVGGALGGYVALRGAHQEAQECRVSLAEAHAELNALKEAQAENERLKAILNYVEASPDQEIVARVIGINPSAQFQSIHINRGENDGVRAGMPVVTPDGVVGHVVRAVGGSADVLLITDPASRIGAVLQRTRVRANVTGGGPARPLVLEIVQREEDVKDADVVVTAGTDGIFPAGLMIGRVRAPERPSVGMFLKGAIEPSVELSHVEEVLVIPVTMGIPSAGLERVAP
ncbi:MAG: rod shape-determining protein MreC [Myxococcaceae bacterium]